MKLLLVAGHSSPHAVGEAWSAYQWIVRLTRLHDVTLIHLCPPGESDLHRGFYPEARMIPFEAWPEIGSAKMQRAIKPGYFGFYLSARSWIQKALRRGEQFELAHQLNPLALRYPSPAAALGLPLVVGPLAGSLDTPPAFAPEFGAAPWYTRLRGLDRWRLRNDPILRRTFESAGAVIGVAPYVREILGDLRIQRFRVMSEAGVVDLPCRASVAARRAGPLRLLFVGRIIRNKGVRDAIRAVGKLETPVRLDVVGEGEDRRACEKLAGELSLDEQVVFHGRVTRDRVDQFYREADAFLFPSFREPSGGVVFEALGFGLPVITADRGGPGHSVDDTCGMKVAVTDPIQFSRDLAACIGTLDRDRTLLSRLAAGARARAEREQFDNKVAWMNDVYREVLGS